MLTTGKCSAVFISLAFARPTAGEQKLLGDALGILHLDNPYLLSRPIALYLRSEVRIIRGYGTSVVAIRNQFFILLGCGNFFSRSRVFVIILVFSSTALAEREVPAMLDILFDSSLHRLTVLLECVATLLLVAEFSL